MSHRMLRSPGDQGGTTTRRGWRGGKGKAASGGGGQYWTQRKNRSTIDSKTRHGLKVGLLFLAAIAILALVVVSIIKTPRNTPVLVVGVTEYSESIPPNGLAREDVEFLESTLQTKNIDPATLQARPQTPAAFLEELEKTLPTLARGRKTVVIYITAHGVLDDQGRPCLLLPESEPHDIATWLPVSDILQKIDSQAGLKKKTNKLLVLDCARIHSDWSLGVVANGFVAALPAVVGEAAVPNLHVLTSTSGQQRTFAAPELGSSPFAYFFARALRGDASTDTNITYDELLEYLQRRVDGYARRYRGGEQVPIIFPELTDRTGKTQVAYATGFEKPKHTPLDVDRLMDRHEELQLVWDEFDKLESAGAFRFAPSEFSTLMLRLKRLEQLLTAGQAYDNEFEATLAFANSLASRIAESQLIRGELGSLALARRFAPKVSQFNGDSPAAEAAWGEVARKEIQAGIWWRWRVRRSSSGT